MNFSKGDVSTSSNYSYHTDAVLEQVINQVMEERGVSRQIAENYVYSSGLTIYSTADKDIQARVEEEYQKDKYIKSGRDKDEEGNLINDHTQSGMAIIDYKTGNVVAVAGGLGEKEASGWNRATQMKKQTGSSIKMIADIVPGLEEGIITPSTRYMDEKTDFGSNYIPKNEDKYDNVDMDVRTVIKKSKNIPSVKIMKELTPKKSIEYLQKMGLESIDEEEDQVLALGIGGMTHGASPLEMAAAYGTIANDGVYITPTFYTKVVDKDGNAVLTPNQEETRVFSEQTAYLAKQIGMEPTKSGGTATYCAISGMDVVAKTGTTDNSNDRWLCGFTPYYSAATWFGYDSNEEVRGFSQNPAGQIWDAIMTDIHSDLEDATFERPNGIVEETVCRTTGCLATTGCTDTYTEIFASNHLPEKCQGHGSQSICSESGKVATEYCSEYCEVTTNYYGAVLPKEQLNDDIMATVGTGTWNAIAMAPRTPSNEYYAVNSKGECAYSRSGSSWVLQTVDSSQEGWNLNDIAFGGGYFVAVGRNGAPYRCTGLGTGWLKGTVNGGSGAYWKCIAYGEGLFVVAGGSSRGLLYSKNSYGSVWTFVSTYDSQNFGSMAYGNDRSSVYPMTSLMENTACKLPETNSDVAIEYYLASAPGLAAPDVGPDANTYEEMLNDSINLKRYYKHTTR